MAIRRVFIYWTHPLFYDSVRMLLNHPEIEWVGSSSDYGAGWSQIMSVPPDTILVEEVEGSIPDEVLHLVEASHWNGRVVGLNIHDNQMRMYQHIQRTVGKAEDLLQWILDDQSF